MLFRFFTSEGHIHCMEANMVSTHEFISCKAQALFPYLGGLPVNRASESTASSISLYSLRHYIYFTDTLHHLR